MSMLCCFSSTYANYTGSTIIELALYRGFKRAVVVTFQFNISNLNNFLSCIEISVVVLPNITILILLNESFSTWKGI